GFGHFMASMEPLTSGMAVVMVAYSFVGLCCFTLIPASAGSSFREAINITTRLVGTLLLGLMALGIALRAAGSLSSERERRTLDSLLTTPLDNLTILGAKWLACLYSVRRFLWGLMPVWLVALVVGGLHPLAL